MSEFVTSSRKVHLSRLIVQIVPQEKQYPAGSHRTEQSKLNTGIAMHPSMIHPTYVVQRI
jgi:hypothetical protein